MTTCPNCGHDLAAITRDSLKTMTAQEIDTARRNGELDHLLKKETK